MPSYWRLCGQPEPWLYRPGTSPLKEDTMAEKNRKKTYLILIVILLVVLAITYL